MRKFIISSSDLDVAFEKLWSLAKENDCQLICDPFVGKIELIKDDKMIASVHTAGITEPYEEAREILKEFQS